MKSKSKSTLRRPTLMVQVITCLCLLALTPLAAAERFNTFYHTDHLGNVIGTSDDDGVYTPIVGNNYDGCQDAKVIKSGEKTLGTVVAVRAVEHAAGLALGAFGRFGVKVSNRVFGAVGGCY